MTQDTHLFQALVLQLSQAAWAALGKVPNPITGTIERNLEAARLHIDTLAAVEKRTHGNLDETESKLLQRVLRDLQLNYVEESKRPDEPAATEEKSEPTGG